MTILQFINYVARFDEIGIVVEALPDEDRKEIEFCFTNSSDHSEGSDISTTVKYKDTWKVKGIFDKAWDHFNETS